MKCDQDLCLDLLYDLKKLLWQDELNPRVRCAFGNVFIGNPQYIVQGQEGYPSLPFQTDSPCLLRGD